MDLVTDLKRIEQLAEAKRDENSRFCEWLKTHADQEMLDQMTHCLYEEVAMLIECSDCANCRTPFADQKDFSSRLQDAVESGAACPVVYNVYERLKNELWGSRRNGCG